MKKEIDRTRLVSRRNELNARIKRERSLETVQPIIDALNERGVAFAVEAGDPNGCLAAWPVLGSRIDWPTIPEATYVATGSDQDRDDAFRSLLSQFSQADERLNIIPSNGDAPIISLLSRDLASACAPILSRQFSLYVAPTNERWLIEHIKGRGLWAEPSRSTPDLTSGGFNPRGLDGNVCFPISGGKRLSTLCGSSCDARSRSDGSSPCSSGRTRPGAQPLQPG